MHARIQNRESNTAVVLVVNRARRLYRIQDLLREHGTVSRDAFLETLQVSRATFKRDLEYLRERLAVPIVWDRGRGGYRLDESDPAASTFQLPGLWFGAQEMHALLTMDRVLETLQPGLLGPQLRPLRLRIRRLLEAGDHGIPELLLRLRVLTPDMHPVDSRIFQPILHGVLARRRLAIVYDDLQTGATTDRVVSPQRLVHYRDRWYLDAWCHLRKALRSFEADAIRSAELLPKQAREIKDETLDAELGASYGIAPGGRRRFALLRFEPNRARVVARRSWHAEHSGEFEIDGSYLLRIPYRDTRAMAMEVLGFGADVEVLAPDSLRAAVSDQLERALGYYRR